MEDLNLSTLFNLSETPAQDGQATKAFARRKTVSQMNSKSVWKCIPDVVDYKTNIYLKTVVDKKGLPDKFVSWLLELHRPGPQTRPPKMAGNGKMALKDVDTVMMPGMKTYP